MKKIYIRPKTDMVLLDTCCICAGSPKTKWVVDDASEDDPEDTPHWGPIILDKGKGNMGDYDPWNSDNW